MVRLIKNNKSGFTLIEITLALLILAVGLVGILTLFPVGFEAWSRAAHITEATFLAQGLLEDIKREGYDDGDPGNETTIEKVLPKDGYESQGFPAPYDNYEHEIEVNSVMDNLAEVIVRVYWPADEGAPEYDEDGMPTGGSRVGQKHIELSTYIADYVP